MTILRTNHTISFKNLAVLLVFALAPHAAHARAVTFKEAPLSIETAQGTQQFTVEIAKTARQQEHGLMFRETLAADRGMIFVWPRDNRVRMWMKNTLISLDMLFIDNAGTIVYIAPRTEVESTDIITAGKPVRMVLELAAGSTEVKHIRVGDHVTLETGDAK